MTHKHHLSRINRLKREIIQLRKIAFAPPEHSTIPDAEYLEIERDSVVRSRVLLDCALVEETAAIIIMDHVLTDCPKWNEIDYFGRIKRYYIFYDDILGRLPARHKIAVVKKFIRIPKGISKTIIKMLALRDVFAHVHTLDYNKKRDLDYKGRSILSKDGFESYIQDSSDAVCFLIENIKVL